MLSKSMPDRSEPQLGIGFLSKIDSALTRRCEHPVGLALLGRDVADDGLGQAALGAGAGDVGVGPAEAVAAERVDLLVLGECGALGGGGHIWFLPDRAGRGCGTGTCVVQTPSPCAMVARRWAYVPSTCSKARVSASQSCGNSAATCATGQWCWHSWTTGAGALAWSKRNRARTARRRRPRRGWRAARRGRRPPAAGRPGWRRGARRTRSTACLTAGLAQVAQRGVGEVVVGVREGGAAGVGQRVGAGRAAAARAAPTGGARARPGCRRRRGRRGAGGCAAGESPRRSARSAALCGPRSSTVRATASRVRSAGRSQAAERAPDGESAPRPPISQHQYDVFPGRFHTAPRARARRVESRHNRSALGRARRARDRFSP